MLAIGGIRLIPYFWQTNVKLICFFQGLSNPHGSGGKAITAQQGLQHLSRILAWKKLGSTKL